MLMTNPLFLSSKPLLIWWILTPGAAVSIFFSAPMSDDVADAGRFAIVGVVRTQPFQFVDVFQKLRRTQSIVCTPRHNKR